MRNAKIKLGLSILIALGLVGLGILADLYLVYVWAAQPLTENQTPINPYQQLYEDLLYPSVRIETEDGIGSGVVIYREVRGEKLEGREKANLQPPDSNLVYILTAAHVVGDYAEVTVDFYHQDTKALSSTSCLRPYGRLCSAFVVLTDTAKDLALLKVITDKPYPYTAKLAPRDYVPYIFTPVWGIGCSLGLPIRPSEGIITAISEGAWEISAPIWPGNSGGGVFLKDTHELIGIAVWCKVYHGQLVSTMAGIVPLQTIYNFLDEYSVKQRR
jgi:S1-C subfamily serine protease